MLLLDDEIYHRLLHEAQDPSTDPTKLEWIAKTMHEEILRNFGWSSVDGIALYQGRANLIIETVAANPNISVKTLMWLALYESAIILYNPVFPLLLLERDWSGWTPSGTTHLRKEAYDQGHIAFPILAGICKEEWRKMAGPLQIYLHGKQLLSVDPADAKCYDPFCAVCRPKKAQSFMAIWREKHEGATSPPIIDKDK